MKRYLLFGGDVYYPSGGAADFKGDYETVDEVVQAVKDYHLDDGYRWANVWDSGEDLAYYLPEWEVIDRV